MRGKGALKDYIIDIEKLKEKNEAVKAQLEVIIANARSQVVKYLADAELALITAADSELVKKLEDRDFAVKLEHDLMLAKAVQNPKLKENIEEYEAAKFNGKNLRLIEYYKPQIANIIEFKLTDNIDINVDTVIKLIAEVEAAKQDKHKAHLQQLARDFKGGTLVNSSKCPFNLLYRPVTKYNEKIKAAKQTGLSDQQIYSENTSWYEEIPPAYFDFDTFQEYVTQELGKDNFNILKAVYDQQHSYIGYKLFPNTISFADQTINFVANNLQHTSNIYRENDAVFFRQTLTNVAFKNAEGNIVAVPGSVTVICKLEKNGFELQNIAASNFLLQKIISEKNVNLTQQDLHAAQIEERINASIEMTEVYAANLSKMGDTKDAKIASDLAAKLTEKKQAFFSDPNKTEATIRSFQRDTRNDIIAADKQLSHRYDSKAVIGNLIIGFSGIGLLALADKAIYSYKTTGQASLFFKREISKQFDETQQAIEGAKSIAAAAA